jgi:hypothetical protein
MNVIVYNPIETAQVYVCFPVEQDITSPSFIKDIPQGSQYSIIKHTDLPDNDGLFITCRIWDDTKENKINHDISKAKEIWKDKFREARKPILEKLDVEFMKALEAGDTQKQQEIASKKQDLRDITNISLPDDIEGIKKVWPSVLNS